jgi:hypothetical protein
MIAGDITVTGETNRGSTFTVRRPAQAVAGEALVAEGLARTDPVHPSRRDAKRRDVSC